MRIISLLPSATEILCALGLRDQLVGVSHECDFPESVVELPRLTSSILQHGLTPEQIDAAVADASKQGQPIYSINPETMESLAPDLVVTQGVCDVCAVGESTVHESLHMIPAPGRDVPVLSLTGVTFAGVQRDIESVGETTGCVTRARDLVLDMQTRWDAVKRSPALENPPRVLMLEWPEPAWTAGHWVPEMVEIAGAKDVFGVPGGVSERKSWDEIAASDPDLIVSIACGHGIEKNLEFARALRNHSVAQHMRAVQSGSVFAADANSFFSRPAPRIVRGAELLTFAFGHPAASTPHSDELVRAW
jgi:iron complex transport system substrate-binding protein